MFSTYVPISIRILRKSSNSEWSSDGSRLVMTSHPKKKKNKLSCHQLVRSVTSKPYIYCSRKLLKCVAELFWGVHKIPIIPQNLPFTPKIKFWLDYSVVIVPFQRSFLFFFFKNSVEHFVPDFLTLPLLFE